MSHRGSPIHRPQSIVRGKSDCNAPCPTAAVGLDIVDVFTIERGLRKLIFFMSVTLTTRRAMLFVCIPVGSAYDRTRYST